VCYPIIYGLDVPVNRKEGCEPEQATLVKEIEPLFLHALIDSGGVTHRQGIGLPVDTPSTML
jgi:hypothetical protein